MRRIDTRQPKDQRDFLWPVFGDIALAMLLLFLLLLIVQVVDYSKLEALETIRNHKARVARMLSDSFGEKVSILDKDAVRQRVTFSSDILFRTCGADSIDMKEGAVPLVRKVGNLLGTVSFYFDSIEVEGHTDERKPLNNEGCPYETNWQLSSARATTVVQLLEQGGIEPVKLSSVGRSEFHPAASIADSLRADPDHVREVYRQNRRIEMILIYKQESTSPSVEGSEFQYD